MEHRAIRIDDQPEAVREFFRQMGDQPVIVELARKPIAMLYPSQQLLLTPEGILADPAGSWWDLPPEIMQSLCGEDT